MNTRTLCLVALIAAAMPALAGVRIGGISNQLQPRTGTLGEQSERNSGGARITMVSPELKGCNYVTISRGEWTKPGRGYSFTVNAQVAVYLSVSPKGNFVPPEDWVKTPFHIEHRGSSNGVDSPVIDDVYTKISKPGRVEIPENTGREGRNYGPPHLAAVTTNLTIARKIIGENADATDAAEGAKADEPLPLGPAPTGGRWFSKSGKPVDRTHLVQLIGFPVTTPPPSDAGSVIELAKPRAPLPPNPTLQMRPGLWQGTKRYVYVQNYKAASPKLDILIQLYALPAEEPQEGFPAFVPAFPAKR